MIEIVKYPDPRLKKIAEPVEKFDKSLHAVLDDMADAMYRDKGIGLAAPQVGLSQRFFIIDLTGTDVDPENEGLKEFINPVLSNGKGKIAFEEGCLSIPGIMEYVDRKEEITVEFQDRNGNALRLEAEGLFAVAIQHENDHLDGILFVDRLSMLKRQIMKKKLKKAFVL